MTLDSFFLEPAFFASKSVFVSKFSFLNPFFSPIYDPEKRMLFFTKKLLRFICHFRRYILRDFFSRVFSGVQLKVLLINYL